MNTVRDTKIDLRVAAPLVAELDRLAEAEGRTRSDVIRRVLIDFVIEHTAARAAA